MKKIYRLSRDEKVLRSYSDLANAIYRLLQFNPVYSTYYIDQYIDNKGWVTLVMYDSEQLFLHKSILNDLNQDMVKIKVRDLHLHNYS